MKSIVLQSFKKVTAIILLAVMVIAVFSISGCTTNNTVAESIATSDAADNDTFENLIEEQSIYEDDNTKISVTEVCFTPKSDTDESNFLKITYTVQNNYKNLPTFSFSFDEVVINGITFSAHGGADIERGQTETVKILIPKELLDIAGIRTIKNIQLVTYYLTGSRTLLTITPKDYDENYKEPYDMTNPLSTEHGINIEYVGKKNLRPTDKLGFSDYLVYKVVNTNDYEIKFVNVNDAVLNSNNVKYNFQVMMDSKIPSHSCSFIYVYTQDTPTLPTPELDGDLAIQFRFFYGDNIDADFVDSKELKHVI